jgi:hypothetical protein
MIRTNVLRIAVAVCSFGALVAVLGAGTKWSVESVWPVIWPW